MGDLKLNQRLLNKACCYSKKRASKTEAFCDRDVLLGSFPEMKYDTSWYHGAFFLSIKCSITFSENRFFKVTGIVNLYKTKIYELTIISYFISKNDSNGAVNVYARQKIISYFISKNDSNLQGVMLSVCFIISYFISKNDSNNLPGIL